MEESPKTNLEKIIESAETLSCPVRKSLVLVEDFLAGPMCGKCFPCSFGSHEAVIRLKAISEGSGDNGDMLALRRIASLMLLSSRCKRGRDVAEFLRRCLETPAFGEHLNGVCPDESCRDFLGFVIEGEKCIKCGLCKDVCKPNAIYGERVEKMLSGYLPFEINAKKCDRCGQCVDACPTGAIVVIMGKDRDRSGEPVANPE
ncbi:MAG: 4Fe-4S binding protein [Nitrospirota bacterium]|jgi:ferredoxin